MSDLILPSIEDVFQIEGRGTLVTGQIGSGWDLAKPGDEIVLLTPTGKTIRTAIKDKELFRKGVLTKQAVPWSGVLLTNMFSSEELPRGTQMSKAPPSPQAS